MNILIINGSPKKRGGASAFFSNVLRFMLFPQKSTVKTLGLSKNYGAVFEHLQGVDAVILSVPLYIDGIPSHILPFLQHMEQYCKDNLCKFIFYVISNSGFVEGCQSRAHLAQYQCWCERAGIAWGGGIGIGGGVMLHVIFYAMFLVNIILFFVFVCLHIVSGKPPVNAALLADSGRSIGIWLFLCGGMFFCEYKMALAIKRKKCIKNQYTRVMIPSFIFLIVSDIFMVLSALIHGQLIFSLYKKGTAQNTQ